MTDKKPNNKNIEVVLKGVRASFMNVVTPKARKSDAGDLTGYNFESSFLIPKEDDKQVEMLRAAMRQALEGRWPGQGMKIPADRRCVRDGEPKDPDTGEVSALYEGYDGCFFVSCNRGVSIDEWEVQKKNPVQLLGPRKDADGKFPRMSGPEASKHFYSGGYYDVVIRIYGYDGSKQGNPNRINASLEAVKFKGHGEAFGMKAVDADNLFDEEPEDSEGTSSWQSCL